MMKKIAVLLLSLSLLATFLTACAQQNAAENEPPVNDVSDNETSEDNTSQEEGIDLTILYEADDDMINNYSLLAVNPDAPFVDADGNAVSDVYINTEGAAALINWMLSEEGETTATEYGYADYGEYLFYLSEGAPVSTAEIPQATEETKVIQSSAA